MKKTQINFTCVIIALLFATGLFAQTVTDIDGNVYETVIIGEQEWTVTNLKVTKYRDGTAIPTGHSNSDWSNLTTGAYAVYDNNESNATTYGYLYNWYAVDDTRNIAPEGWHVPTDDEWQTLVDYLGGSSIAGGKMKETGTEHWNSPNTGATNESGFMALPGGFRSYNGGYTNMGYNCYFWSSTESSSTNAWYRILSYNNSDVYRSSYSKHYGFSVRVVRDATEPTSTIYIPADYPTIQAGIDVANDGDMILVADGTYTGTGNKDLSWSGLEKHLVIRSENGPENCIIDLENDGRAFTFNSTPTQLWITREDVIEGFTIRNGGNVTYGGAMYLYYGYNNDLSPTVLNCVFENNSAENGGAVYANGASPLFEYCVFKDNTAQSNGGAVYLASSGGNNGTEILSCTIKNNQASSKAGGIYFSNIGDVEGCFIEESLFKENDAPNGGAMYLSSSNPTLINNLIINNSASSAGPALYVYNFGGPKVIHCTITDNTGGQYAVYNHAFNGSVNPIFINSIIWGNSGNVGPEGGQNAPQFQNCNVGDGLPTGSTDLGGNMDVYAEFNDPYIQDYHLQNSSPMIGAGMILEPDVADGDMDGNPRPNPGGSNPDIGCFESDLGTPES
ncbi:MAG: hypothetical protein H8E64_02020, partial [Candidatus Marinimicrobia bacterium]|nr:hypothetical protein [Candidatus Neomarinimicrobiota bacterium]